MNTLPRHIELLTDMVRTPSLSRKEDGTATLIHDRLRLWGAEPRRHLNNVWAVAPGYRPDRPTLLLNSHHDTVRPADSYTRDPYSPDITSDGRLYGLGSNDAGASAASLLETFMRLRLTRLPFNLIVAVTAEEEVGGENGMRAFLPHLKEQGYNVDCAIVGEPTGMQPAVAERGLVVLDCVTRGVTGHAARGEGINAIYRAITDIEAMRGFRPDKVSEVLGPIGVNITQIDAGWQHNAIPDECRWVVDVRTTDAYTNEETVKLMQSLLSPHTEAVPRSTRVRASVIASSHPLVRGAVSLGGKPFVSPTTSDMSLMWDFPSLKIGPGDSARSHSADEYVLLSEIHHAVDFYTNLLTTLIL